MTTFAVDLSDYDHGRGQVDVAAMRADGVSMLTHKITEGTSIVHQYGGATLAAARDAGMAVIGGYMVPRTPGNGGHGTIAAQVGFYLAQLEQAAPWLLGFSGGVHQVDTERWDYDHVAPELGAQACALLRTRTGQPVIHYAPRWSYGNSVPGDDPLWSSNYPPAVASHYLERYTEIGADSGPGWVAYSGRTPLLWQYSSTAVVGSSSTVDVSAFRGTVDELKRALGMIDMTPEQDRALHTLERLFSALVDTSDPEQLHVHDVYDYVGGPAREYPVPFLARLARIETAVNALAAAPGSGGGVPDIAPVVAAVESLQVALTTAVGTVAALRDWIASLPAAAPAASAA